MNKYLKYIIFGSIVVLLFSIIQAKIHEFLGIDAYYHAHVTQLILESNNLIDKFPWLQYTILNDNFVEHHLFFHVLLTPFFKLFSPFLAAKIAVVLFSSGFIFVFLAILKKLKIKYPIFWSLLMLFSSSWLIYRLNLLRAQSIALILLMLGIYFLLQKKYLALIPITILYTWLFDGFVILGIVIAVKVAVDLYYLIRTKNKNLYKDIFYPPLYYLSGILIAIIFNPYFPRNIYHLFFHLYQVALKDPFSSMPVGVEWYMSTPEFFISSAFIIITLLSLSIFALIYYKVKKIRLPKNILFLFTLALIFFFLTIVVRRLIEYSAPIIILLAAYLFTLNYNRIRSLAKQFTCFKKLSSLKFILIILLFTAAIYNFQDVYFNLNNDAEERINVKKAADWMAKNINPGEIIYHLDWSESVQLIYYNDQHYYIAGLDPNFMKEYDLDLYQKWHQLFTQTNLEQSFQIIKNDFMAKYVYVNNKYDKFIDNANSDPRFKHIYSNDTATIYNLE